LVASCVTAPLELVKTRQAAQIGGGQAARGLWAELQTIVHTEGAISLYRGLSPTLLRDMPFSAVYWYFIEYFRSSWGDSDRHLSPLEQGVQALINGSAAGMIAAAVSTPLDVVKTRQQVTPSPSSSAIEVIGSTISGQGGAMPYGAKAPSPQPMGTVATMVQILKEEGIRGLWRGNQTRMIKVAPACAIMLSSYEIGKRVLAEST
jgi:solute carrier family 25, member 39/40